MALGPRDRHRLDPHPYRLHLAAKPRPDQTKDPTGLRKARLPSDTGQLVIPTGDNRLHKPASTGSVQPGQAARKIEASGGCRAINAEALADESVS
jgi:hypothetical protein